jgi:starch synthase
VRILLASSEVYPYSKTGGLGDAVGALGKALAKAGHEVAIVTPLHRGVRERFVGLRRVDWRFDLPIGAKRVDAALLAHDVGPRLTTYFIDNPGYFNRAGIYGEDGSDYGDNAERFIFFCKCVVHLARHLPWKAEVLHVHDWPTGLVPLLVQHEHRAGGWAKPPRLCLTIHNLAYQGVFPRSAFSLTNLPANLFHPDTTEFYGQLNFLKAGIACADIITTVSPRYAREITTQEYGAGLDGLLRKRQQVLHGILNGVDYDEWNTTDNPSLAAPFSVDNLSGKAACKAALQKRMGLPVNAEIPIFGSVTRLAEQKGIDLTLGALEEMLAGPIQFVMLGSGSKDYERALQALASRQPEAMAVQIGYDHSLAHQIEAGSDFFLMPSRFEPCGLNQLYSLRYGAIPIVRRTGGLDDTVIDATDDATNANGVKFHEPAAQALAKAMRKALLLFQDRELLDRYRANGMKVNFSWSEAVKEFESAYGR